MIQRQGSYPLDELVELGEGRLDPALLDRLRAVQQRTEQRLAHSQEHVVVALAGGTGSGKSSLLNALLGSTISTPGVKRPTTNHAVAVTIGAADDQALSLLDWLQVSERHSVAAEGALDELAGAIILDLPDIDSVVTAHWDSAELLIERCDLLIWVLDPLKYAHALAHQQYFANLAHHAEVLLVALNHADRLAQGDRTACLEHLQELLSRHALNQARTLPSSAKTGEGVDLLRHLIAAEARERRAPFERLRADRRSLQELVARALPAPESFRFDASVLPAMQHEAINEADIVEVAAMSYRRLGRLATSSPTQRLVFRWLGGLWRALSGKGGSQEYTGTSPRIVVATNRLRYGLVDAVDGLAGQLPGPASRRLRAQAEESAEPLAQALRESLADLPIEPHRRWWWRSLSVLRGVGELSAVAGMGWLVARSAADWLVLPPVPVPMVIDELGWPPVLVMGGIAASTLLGLAARPGLVVGARRHSSLVGKEIDRRIRSLPEEPLSKLYAEMEMDRRLAVRARQVEG